MLQYVCKLVGNYVCLLVVVVDFLFLFFFKQLHSVAKTSTVGAVVSSEQQLRDIILL